MAKINVQLQNKTSYQSYKFQVRPLDSDMMRVDHCKQFEHKSYMNYISNNSQFSVSTTKQAILPVYKFQVKQLDSNKMPEDPCKLYEHWSNLYYLSNISQVKCLTTKQAILPVV
jgi:hypothetical protein